jgi:hypothetical protein
MKIKHNKLRAPLENLIISCMHRSDQSELERERSDVRKGEILVDHACMHGASKAYVHMD